jgi:hypothetical protein
MPDFTRKISRVYVLAGTKAKIGTAYQTSQNFFFKSVVNNHNQPSA